MKVRKLLCSILSVAFLSSAFSVAMLPAGAAEGEALPLLDLSGLLDGHTAAASDANGMAGWDEEGKVIQTKSSVEQGWGAAKGALIDGVAYDFRPSGDWGYFGFSYFSDPGSYTSTDVDEWIVLNLQKPYLVDQLGFRNMNSWDNQGMPADFKFDVSMDGENWTNVVTKTGVTFEDAEKTVNPNTQQEAPNGSFRYPFEAKTCQYVRMSISKVATGTLNGGGVMEYNVVLSELYVYGKIAPHDPLPKMDLTPLLDDYDLTDVANEERLGSMMSWDADQKVIKASSAYTSPWAGGTGRGYLIDGHNDPAEWNAGIQSFGLYVSGTDEDGNFVPSGLSAEKPVTITINLGEEYRLDKYVFYGMWGVGNGKGKGLPSDFTIAVSKDGETFTTVKEVVGMQPNEADTNAYEIPFDEIVNGQYVRLSVTKTHTPLEGIGAPGEMALSEIEPVNPKPEEPDSSEPSDPSSEDSQPTPDSSTNAPASSDVTPGDDVSNVATGVEGHLALVSLICLGGALVMAAALVMKKRVK